MLGEMVGGYIRSLFEAAGNYCDQLFLVVSGGPLAGFDGQDFYRGAYDDSSLDG